MQIASGSYAGSGVAQSITGVGFEPDAVFIKGGANIAQLCTSTMGADKTKPLTGGTALQAGRVTSLDSDGFSVGTDAQVNANGTTYYWMAFQVNNVKDCAVGTYTGNATDNRSITVGFQPDMVIVMRDATDATASAIWRTSDMVGDSSQIFDGILGTNSIQAFEANGFQVGTSGNVNDADDAYHWFAIKNATDLFKAITYTGNGSDSRSITGAGFQPDNVWTEIGATGTSTAMIMRFKDQVGDSSFRVDANTAAANRIQALEADGFQVGTDSGVNLDTFTYNAVVFKDGATVQGGGSGGGGKGGGRGGGNGGGGGGGNGGGGGGGGGNGGGGSGGGLGQKKFVSSRKWRVRGAF